MNALRLTAALACCLAAGACSRAPAPVTAPVEVSAAPSSVILAASCDVAQRLAEERSRLESAGAVEIAGGQPYRWHLECRGAALFVEVSSSAPTADGEPVLWVGAVGDPPGVVTIQLDVGAGQEQLRQRLKALEGTESFQIDLATGVVSDS